MNLSRMFEMQKSLDEKIEQEKPTQPGEDRLAKKILALQVEIGELANEWRGFKFWSRDQQPRILEVHEDPFAGIYKEWNPLLEEYVDCLHFILSIGLDIGVTNPKRENLHEELVDTTEAFQHAFNWCATLDYARAEKIWNGKATAFERLVDVFLSLGYFLGFTLEQIESAYIAKNEVNHQRQVNGY